MTKEYEEEYFGVEMWAANTISVLIIIRYNIGMSMKLKLINYCLARILLSSKCRALELDWAAYTVGTHYSDTLVQHKFEDFFFFLLSTAYIKFIYRSHAVFIIQLINAAIYIYRYFYCIHLLTFLFNLADEHFIRLCINYV